MMEITISKISTEMKTILTWLVENVENGYWETSKTNPINGDLFTVMAKNSEGWAKTVASYKPIVINNPARFTGLFLFKNPKDAMLFKLRWA